MPELHVAQIGIHLRGTRIEVAERLLHHMQRIAFLHHVGAARVPQLVQGVARLAHSIHQPVWWLRASSCRKCGSVKRHQEIVLRSSSVSRWMNEVATTGVLHDYYRRAA